ncbi:MAG: prolipoprotein diacylglyceryl transferase [Acidimicrobiales bacterium]|nr:prolipoprotein diacylglyceryl transferase [Acidimicrobiales bacterium]
MIPVLAGAGSWLASIPSPGSNAIHLGPLQLRAYGVMIALGVLAAAWLANRRWIERGGAEGDIANLALWAVPAGVVGARLYHVITDYQRFTDDPIRALYIWEGGLGIPGGIALGAAAGVWVAHRRHLPLGPLADAIAPALPLAQAIGRLGNWFNQELFGRPTTLPWGLEIDPDRWPAGYVGPGTFHPAFLYEVLWNLALVGLLLWVDRRRWLPRGYLFALYVGGYALGRLWIERLRIDPANEILGLRVNEVVMGVLLVGSVAFLVFGLVRHRGEPREAIAGQVSAVPPGADVDATPEETSE